jgi:hypothetical protein
MPKSDTLPTEMMLPFEKTGGTGDVQQSILEEVKGYTPEDEPVSVQPEDAAEPALEGDEADEVELDDEVEEEAAQDDDESGPEGQADESDEEPDATPRYRVKVDGQELEVPLPELLAGYSRQKAFDRRMADVDKMRKQVEADAESTKAVRDQYAERITAYDEWLNNSAPSEPDWDKLKAEDPTKYAVAWAEHQQFQVKRQSVQAERQRLDAAKQQEQQEAYEKGLNAERLMLLDKIPEWNDEATAGAEKAKLKAYITDPTTYGYSDEQLANVTDHRLMVMIRKAMLWDESQARGPAMVREKTKTARVLKPGGRITTGPSKGERAAKRQVRERAAQSGLIEDVAASILADNLLD